MAKAAKCWLSLQISYSVLLTFNLYAMKVLPAPQKANISCLSTLAAASPFPPFSEKALDPCALMSSSPSSYPRRWWLSDFAPCFWCFPPSPRHSLWTEKQLPSFHTVGGGESSGSVSPCTSYTLTTLRARAQPSHVLYLRATAPFASCLFWYEIMH